MTIFLEKDMVEYLAGYGKLRLDIFCPDKGTGFSFMLRNMNPGVRESGESGYTEVSVNWTVLDAALSNGAGVVLMDPGEKAMASFYIEGSVSRTLFAREETMLETIQRISSKN